MKLLTTLFFAVVAATTSIVHAQYPIETDVTTLVTPYPENTGGLGRFEGSLLAMPRLHHRFTDDTGPWPPNFQSELTSEYTMGLMAGVGIFSWADLLLDYSNGWDYGARFQLWGWDKGEEDYEPPNGFKASFSYLRRIPHLTEDKKEKTCFLIKCESEYRGWNTTETGDKFSLTAGYRFNRHWLMYGNAYLQNYEITGYFEKVDNSIPNRYVRDLNASGNIQGYGIGGSYSTYNDKHTARLAFWSSFHLVKTESTFGTLPPHGEVLVGLTVNLDARTRPEPKEEELLPPPKKEEPPADPKDIQIESDGKIGD